MPLDRAVYVKSLDEIDGINCPSPPAAPVLPRRAGRAIAGANLHHITTSPPQGQELIMEISPRISSRALSACGVAARRMARALCLASAALVTVAIPLTAEPTTIGEDKVAALKLDLVADDALGGVSARIQGETGPETTRYFFVEGLNVMSPIAIRVLAVDPAQPVNVALHREFWNRAEMNGVTDAQGNFATDTRIDGDLGIAISADQPSGFYLLIWTDTPVEVPMPKMLFIDGKLVDLNAKEEK
jgi:hypothetical protein